MRVGGYVWAVYVLIVMCACKASSLVVDLLQGWCFKFPLRFGGQMEKLVQI